MKKSVLSVLLALSLFLPACNGLVESTISESLKSDSYSTSVSFGSNGDYGSYQDEHADENNDGKCDDCGNSVLVTLDFFALNDLHGKFADTDTQPGVDELSTHIKQTRAKNANTIVLSSGDMWQGSAESNATKGAIVTEWMNEMAFSAMTLGNHEYDWGEEYIEKNAALAQFPFLAINVYDRQTNRRVDYCQPSVLVEKSGARIGIIGAIGDCYSSISASFTKDVTFKTGKELSALVQAEAKRLREEEGADYIVYSLHDGESGYDNSLSNGYVDLVFEGHTHQSYVKKDSYGVYHLQNGGDNDGVSHAQVTVNYANEKSEVKSATFLSTNSYAHLEGDSVVDSLMEKYAEEIALTTKVLGENDRVRGEEEILTACAKLYYEAGIEKWGDSYDVVLGGAFMSLRAPYKLHAGTVVYGDLMSILPFDNKLVLCSILGWDLREKFLETTNEDYYIYCGAYYAEIKENIRGDQRYYIVTDTYTSDYRHNNLTVVEYYDDTTFPRDLYAKYIEGGNLKTDLSKITLTAISDVLAIGEALPTDGQTKESYFVKGTVASISDPSKGILYIQDDKGNSLYVYRIQDKEGNAFSSMADKPKVGDRVLLESPIKKFGADTVEFYNAVLWSVEKEK